MAIKKQQNRTQFYADVEFIDFYITADEEQKFKVWFLNKQHEVDEALRMLFADQYRISVRWDDFNNCYMASLSTRNENSSNAKKIMNGRSDDWFEAVALAAFKHEVIFERGEWKNPPSALRNWG